MTRDAASAQTRGILLALVTVFCWSVLPITLRIASRQLDPYTLTWYRFALSALALAAILGAKRQLPPLSDWRAPRPLALLVAATLGLLANYVLYLVSLDYVSPTVGGIITQLGPLLLMFGGVWLFKEKLSRKQIVGIVLLIAGMLLFFNRQLGAFASLTGREGAGTVILLVASVVWAVYGLAQKALTRHLTANQILLLIYIGATIALVAFTKPLSVRGLGALELTMLALSALNTLVAYGALAEALKGAGAATVGAVLAVGPVATLVVTWLSNKLSPGFFPPDDLNVATIAGAIVVTVGSALSAHK
jgi:drug/metabolite transporter (DMT)-like permease